MKNKFNFRINKKKQENFEYDEMFEQQPQQTRKSKEKNPFLSSLKEWVTPIALAVIMALAIRSFIGGATTVQGDSMEPTLHNADVLLVNKIPTYRSDFKRMQIAIINPPQIIKDIEHEDKLFVKRIIGMPGETIRIENNQVFINNQLLKEYYLGEPETSSYSKSEWILGENEYFVLGDNRAPGKSNDSRIFGPITKEEVKAIVVFRLWPLTSIEAF